MISFSGNLYWELIEYFFGTLKYFKDFDPLVNYTHMDIFGMPFDLNLISAGYPRHLPARYK